MKLFGRHFGHGHAHHRHPGEPLDHRPRRGQHAEAQEHGHRQDHGYGMHGGGDTRGGGRGGRGGRRVFEQGGLRLVLLHLIGGKPSHGYELIKAIEERFNGAYSPSPGVVYPTLTLLEELGYASVEATDGGRKRYSITEPGRAHLAENRETTDAMLARMNGAAGAGANANAGLSAHPPQVVRALENFKLAVRMRLSRGTLTDEQAHKIAATLDAAAQNLERI